LNSDITTNNNYPLIHCKNGKENCDFVRKSDLGNGYYLNKEETTNPRYVVCNDGVCETRPLNKINENSSKYKVRYDEDEIEFYFQKYKNSITNNVKISDESSTKYYYIEDHFKPGRHFNYPDSFIGDNKYAIRGILFKIDAYSVVTITEEKQPLGYVTTDENEIIKCQFNKEGKKEYIVVTPSVIENCKDDDGTGKIYKEDDEKFICINSTKVQINAVNEVEYLMPLVDGLFGINNTDNNKYYIRVKMDGKGNVLTALKKSETVMYRYANRLEKYKIYAKTDAVDETSSHTYEYKLVLWQPSLGFVKEIEYYRDGDNSDLPQE